ncbi:MAG: hypothetical protein ACI30S_08580 [Muribaculaceae bacterium]
MKRIKIILFTILIAACCSFYAEGKTRKEKLRDFTVTATDTVNCNGEEGINFHVDVKYVQPYMSLWVIVDICRMDMQRIYVDDYPLRTWNDTITLVNTQSISVDCFISYETLAQGGISRNSPFKYFVSLQNRDTGEQIKATCHFDWR